jgi:hypothetical protein
MFTRVLVNFTWVKLGSEFSLAEASHRSLTGQSSFSHRLGFHPFLSPQGLRLNGTVGSGESKYMLNTREKLWM